MSMNLDKSLDEIVSTRRNTTRRGRGRRAPAPGRKATTAPVGGIAKNTKSNARLGGKGPAPNGAVPASGESKVVVSNLPPDVSEAQIKEYFQKSVGSVKRVFLTYGPNGVSRGIATVVFSKPGSANDAIDKLDGLLVDKRPMKIEIVLDRQRAPAPPTMSDRITRPKVQPKQASAPKPARGEGTRGRGERGGRRTRNAERAKPKTAEELDAEMTDYFVGGTEPSANTNGAAPVANGGEDLGMDEVL
ncbi:hypothetical protein MMC13_001919 [Lambiella insularis]|nr:hypothetical protein [Lambiella insularis]